MSDPKHPLKLVIIVEGGLVQRIISDKKIDARIFVADYDADDGSINGDETHGGGRDKAGNWRFLAEWRAVVDSMGVRSTINKKKGEK